ncbi:MAG: hypothetical protein K2K44_08260 [Oscillospiraceae bacterium]|nr:hypothetical protein [Oscillospiraceae bacterium]
MSVLSILGEIVMAIGGAITGSVSSNLNSMSRDKRFSDEDREKCSNASEELAGYSDKMRSKANEFKEQRQNENN